MEAVFGPLDQALRFLGSHAALWAYGLLVVSAATEMLFPPFPGDVVFISGMVLAGGGALSWPIVFTASLVGGLAGAGMLYELGRWKGRAWFRRPERKVFNPRVLERIDGLFGRYGFRVLVVSRFFPAIRSAAPIAAGIAGLDRRRTVLYLAAAIAIWNGILTGIGIAFGRNWEAVSQFLMLYNRIVIGLMIIAGLGAAIWVYKKSKAASDEKNETAPEK